MMASWGGSRKTKNLRAREQEILDIANHAEAKKKYAQMIEDQREGLQKRLEEREKEIKEVPKVSHSSTYLIN